MHKLTQRLIIYTLIRLCTGVFMTSCFLPFFYTVEDRKQHNLTLTTNHTQLFYKRNQNKIIHRHHHCTLPHHNHAGWNETWEKSTQWGVWIRQWVAHCITVQMDHPTAQCRSLSWETIYYVGFAHVYRALSLKRDMLSTCVSQICWYQQRSTFFSVRNSAKKLHTTNIIHTAFWDYSYRTIWDLLVLILVCVLNLRETSNSSLSLFNKVLKSFSSPMLISCTTVGYCLSDHLLYLSNSKLAHFIENIYNSATVLIFFSLFGCFLEIAQFF